MARHADFTTIRTEGALLPPDLLRRLRDNDKELPGLTPDAYHLIGNTRISEAISEAWNKLQVAWNNFQDTRANIPVGAPGTAATRDRWLLPLFQVLDYGRLQTTTAREVAGKDFPISHGWAHVPIHLVGCNVDLDTRSAGVAGAARQSPHGLVQAYLNTSDESLWGIVSNGLRLRLLRDNHALTRQAYLEFDLETMFTGEVYPDFVLLFLTLHQSRLEGAQPEDTILEQWSRAAQEQGTRALDRLRDGVQDALTTLGQGFLEHPANTNLRTTLKDGTLTPQDYYRQLLRVVYRFLVLFAAEDRDLLHAPDTDDATRQRYAYYSTRRLRELADAIPGGRHPDQYQLLKRTWGWLSNDGAPGLGIPALGGFLFGPTATRDLDDAQLTNRHLLTAVRQLAFTQVNDARYPVDYKSLGAEELGSVYESLLEFQPLLDTDSGAFTLQTLGGNERKTTGSYYTPTRLITLLLDSALNPVLEEAAGKSDPEKAILELKIVDPASGSGHFLISAAHRIARRLAQARTGDDEPTPQATRSALRDTIAHCIYGVDLNDMAAELCKVALWLEALEPGKPLTFLDHHIKTGNSLIGAPLDKTTATIVATGIPDEAYVPLTGDDKTFARGARDRNRREAPKGAGDRGSRQVRLGLFPAPQAADEDTVGKAIAELEAAPDDTIEHVRKKVRAFAALHRDDAYSRTRDVANAYVAAFLWPKHSGEPAPITSGDLADLANGTHLAPERRSQLLAIAQRHKPFHWRFEFPNVFERSRPGFDSVLGNPPWISHAGRAAQPIPDHVKNFYRVHFLSFSGYPSTHGMFVEQCTKLLREGGRMGLIIPSSVSELDGYTSARCAHDMLCDLPEPLTDFGEGQFVGVTQPCMAVVSVRGRLGRLTGEKGEPWPIRRPDLTDADVALINRLSSLGPLPADLFGERGLQSDKSLVRCMSEVTASDEFYDTPLREGSDVREFELLPPRLYASRSCLGDRLRPQDQFDQVALVVRQTARYPIAAVNDGCAFRNSLLAVFSTHDWPASVLLALLNSAVVRWFHFVRFRDARQPVMPQLKIGHLRAIPVPPHMSESIATELGDLANSVMAANRAPTAGERDIVDTLVARAYGLDETERSRVMDWHVRHGPSNKSDDPKPVTRRSRAC